MHATADKVVIDTSVWIDLFRTGRATDIVRTFTQNKTTAVCGPILTELYRGAKGKKELELIEDLRRTVSYIELTEAHYAKAGMLGKQLAAAGLSLHTVDLIIAQICLDTNSAIFSYDKHFSEIAKHVPLHLIVERS